MAGKQGYSVEEARHFARVLSNVSRAPFSPLPELPGNPSIFVYDRFSVWGRALTDLFEKHPEWETRLRAWIAEVAPPAEENPSPAWMRVRQRRRHSAR